MSKNSAILVGYYGGDKTHSLAAWSSTYLELGLELPDNIEDRVDVIVDDILTKNKKMRNIEQLLKYLGDNNHGSPFEFSFLHFLTTEDLKSHIHSIKHRVHAKNSESSRYKERVEDKFYIPEDWGAVLVDHRHHNMNYISNQVKANWGEYSWKQALADYTLLGNKLYHKCIEDLTPVLGKVRAKESAAYFLTLNNQLNTNDGWNFRSFVNFQKLRNSKSAQKEIKDLAQCMLDGVKNITGNPFEFSLKAFNL